MTDLSTQSIDPEAAVWNQDAEELRRALAAGWSLPFARIKEGRVQDLTLAIRAVTHRWSEGWGLLADSQPSLRTNPVLFQLALRRGAALIVEDFVKHGTDVNEPLESGLLPIHVLAEALKEQPGEPVDESDFLETARFLVKAGANPLIPYPGQAFPDAPALASGHTLWTRAVWLRRWEIAKAFMPQSWSELLAMPLSMTVLEELRQNVQSEVVGALGVWQAVAGRFLVDWMISHPEEAFNSDPDLAILPQLEAPLQSAIWERWCRPDNSGWTGLHDLGLSGGKPLAHAVLRDMIAKQAPCLADWAKEDNEGVRPCDLWEIANGRSFQEGAEPRPFASLPELNS